MLNRFTCIVCGFDDLKHEPHSEHNVASDEICPSCGYHFGYDDDLKNIPYETWRRDWLQQGAHWFSPNLDRRPIGWSGLHQLEAWLSR